jgi:hypothetical protein
MAIYLVFGSPMALPKSHAFVHQHLEQFSSHCKIVYSYSKAMKKREIEEHEPLDLVLWYYLPDLRREMQNFFNEKGPQMNKLYSKATLKKTDQALVCLLRASICTSMFLRTQQAHIQ